MGVILQPCLSMQSSALQGQATRRGVWCGSIRAGINRKNCRWKKGKKGGRAAERDYSADGRQGLCNTAHLFTPCSLHMCASVHPNTAHTRSSLVSKRVAETAVNKSD